MEPTLNDIDDYDKPLSRPKRRWILIAFGIAAAVYWLYVWLMTSL